MSAYRVLYTQLKTGAVIGELPATSFSFSEAMNAAGSASVDVLLEDTSSIEYATREESYATFVDGYYRASPLPTGYAAAGVGVTLDVRFRINGGSGGGTTQEIITNGTSGGGGSGFIIRWTGSVLRLVFNDGTWRTASSPSYTGGDTTVRVVSDGTDVTWYTSDNYGLSWDVWAAAASFPYSPLSGGFWDYLDIGAGNGSSQFIGDIYWIEVWSAGVQIFNWTPDDLTDWTLSGNEDVTLTLVEASATLTSPQQVTMSTIAPGATGIYIERDGVLIWGGIVWSYSISVADSKISLSCEGFMSYFRHVHISDDLTYTSYDQGAIAVDLLDYAIAKPGALSTISTSAVDTSVNRDRFYPAIERKPVGEAIEQLANVDGGFTWRFEHGYVGNDIVTSFAADVTELGRLTSHVFELGVNITMLNLTADGTGLAAYSEAWGQGEGEVGYYQSSYNSGLLSSHPLLERIETYTDVKELATLQLKATQMNARGSTPIQRLTVKVFHDTIPYIGSYEIGDRVKVRATYGGLALDGYYRIIEMSVNVNEAGVEDIQLTLVPQEIF